MNRGRTINTEEEAMTIRPSVRRFNVDMEKKLRANDHKECWNNDTQLEILSNLKEEVTELEEAIEFGLTSEEIIKEYADIANYAMMGADNLREDA